MHPALDKFLECGEFFTEVLKRNLLTDNRLSYNWPITCFFGNFWHWIYSKDLLKLIVAKLNLFV